MHNSLKSLGAPVEYVMKQQMINSATEIDSQAAGIKGGQGTPSCYQVRKFSAKVVE